MSFVDVYWKHAAGQFFDVKLVTIPYILFVKVLDYLLLNPSQKFLSAVIDRLESFRRKL